MSSALPTFTSEIYFLVLAAVALHDGSKLIDVWRRSQTLLRRKLDTAHKCGAWNNGGRVFSSSHRPIFDRMEMLWAGDAGDFKKQGPAGIADRARNSRRITESPN